MTEGAFPFFRHSVKIVHARSGGCEIPVILKPQEGPVQLCGKRVLENLYCPDEERQGDGESSYYNTSDSPLTIVDRRLRATNSFLAHTTNRPRLPASVITADAPELNSRKSLSMPSLKITPLPAICETS